MAEVTVFRVLNYPLDVFSSENSFPNSLHKLSFENFELAIERPIQILLGSSRGDFLAFPVDS